MNKHYNVETPGVYSFKTLFLMSIAVLSLFEPGTNTIGIVLLIWGGFTLLRAIWMIETMLKTQRGTVRSRLLPWVILSGMERRERTNIAKHAYRIFNGPFLFWFICAGLFLIGTISGNALSDLTPAQQEANILISTFYEAEALPHIIYDAATIQDLLIRLGQLLLIGMVFFMAHTYAYTDYKSDRIWWGPFFMFVLLMIAYVIFFGVSTPTIPQGAKAFMYLAGGLSVWIFIHAWRRNAENGRDRAKYAQLGLFCLCGLGLSDLIINVPDNAAALWLSGWTSVSILWVRALGDESKKYLPYQV